MLAYSDAALDAGDAAAIGYLAVAVAGGSRGAVGAVVVDPLRLPFVEALFDVAVVTDALEASDAPAVLLRELRRVLAPAGVAWIVVPRRRLSLSHGAPGHHFSRARLDRLLVEAMLEPVDWQTIGAAYLVRAEPRGGVSPPPLTRVATRLAPA